MMWLGRTSGTNSDAASLSESIPHTRGWAVFSSHVAYTRAGPLCASACVDEWTFQQAFRPRRRPDRGGLCIAGYGMAWHHWSRRKILFD